VPHPVLTSAIDRVASGQDLSADETAAVLSTIMGGEAGQVQIAAFLIALRTKEETEDELAGLARAMRTFATPVDTAREDLLDVVGTGGGKRTFNVSTTAALIAAGAGCAVAKHGNRSATSLSGAADVLEALGARIDLSAPAVGRCLDEVGFGFLFAPTHHQATRYVVPVRAELAVRTVFNLLGPLTNPAGAPSILMGVFHPDLVGIQVRVLQELGAQRALVVWGRDGMDELSLGAGTLVGELRDGTVREYELHPEDFGIAMAHSRNLRVAGPAESQAMLLAALENRDGLPREIVAYNAGAALYAAGVADTIDNGIARAREAIASGAARAKLDEFVSTTQTLARASA
jgi:anthranilate phosphoribosyltransferase